MDNQLPTASGRGSAVEEFDIAEDGRETVITSVVAALSKATGLDPLEMLPLATYVDTDALEQLMSTHTTRDGSAGDVTVSFTVAEHDVTIESHGLVYVERQTSTQ